MRRTAGGGDHGWLTAVAATASCFAHFLPKKFQQIFHMGVVDVKFQSLIGSYKNDRLLPLRYEICHFCDIHVHALMFFCP